MPKTVSTKPYDWTYTTTYKGTVSRASDDGFNTPRAPLEINWSDADPLDRRHVIPIAELTRPDPILFYAEIPIFEDELHDNGSSTLLIKIVRKLVQSVIFLAYARL